MTTVQALKDLYVALGGAAADVADCNTNVDVLNVISAKYEGADNAVLNPEAIANIAAVADQIGGGGGGDSDFSTATVTINNTVENSSIGVLCSYIVNDDILSSDSVSYGTKQITMILYKGSAELSIDADEITSTSGDIEETDDLTYSVTGDCTITGKGVPIT